MDHVSKGRLILGLAIGAPPDVEFEYFGEVSDAKVRAEMLEEGLDIITNVWSGEPFSFEGKHYQLKEMTFLPKPRQEPRIPIWIGGGVPYKAPFKRAARYEGVSPVHSRWPEPLTPQHLEEILETIKTERGNLKNYDIVVCGDTTGTDSKKDREVVEPWIQAGATWFQENINGMRAEIDELRDRIRAGPPRV